MAKRVFKKKKSIRSGGKKVFRPWDQYAVGDVIIGKYVGIHTDNYDNECIMLEVEDAQVKDKKFAKECSAEGVILVLNSSGALKKAMEKMEEGKLYQFEYAGTNAITKGKFKGKDAHSINVDEVEDEDAEDADDEEFEDEDSDDEDEDDSDDDEDDEDAL